MPESYLYPCPSCGNHMKSSWLYTRVTSVRRVRGASSPFFPIDSGDIPGGDLRDPKLLALVISRFSALAPFLLCPGCGMGTEVNYLYQIAVPFLRPAPPPRQPAPPPPPVLSVLPPGALTHPREPLSGSHTSQETLGMEGMGAVFCSEGSLDPTEPDVASEQLESVEVRRNSQLKRNAASHIQWQYRRFKNRVRQYIEREEFTKTGFIRMQNDSEFIYLHSQDASIPILKRKKVLSVLFEGGEKQILGEHKSDRCFVVALKDEKPQGGRQEWKRAISPELTPTKRFQEREEHFRTVTHELRNAAEGTRSIAVNFDVGDCVMARNYGMSLTDYCQFSARLKHDWFRPSTDDSYQWYLLYRSLKPGDFLFLMQDLAQMHQKGHTHGDIKPDNILIDTYGYLRLIDSESFISKPSGFMGTPSYFPMGLRTAVSPFAAMIQDDFALLLTILECDEYPLIFEKKVSGGAVASLETVCLVHKVSEELGMLYGLEKEEDVESSLFYTDWLPQHVKPEYYERIIMLLMKPALYEKSIEEKQFKYQPLYEFFT